MRARPILIALAGLALILGACTNPGRLIGAGQPARRRPRRRRRSAPASAAPRVRGPGLDDAAEGRLHLARRVHPVRQLVTDNIKAEAEKAGVEVAFCDSEIDAAKALACAQNLKVQDVEAVLNFQLFEASSPEVCAAYGDLPTIAIDILQAPCEIAFMGADNTLAGMLAGKYVGDALKAENDCDLRSGRHARHQGCRRDHPGPRERHDRRLRGGLRQDRSSQVQEPIDVGGTTDLAVTKFGDQLSAIKPGGKSSSSA